MTIHKALLFFFFSSSLILLSSCNKKYKNDDYTAYFGGEVINPTNPYVLFCKDAKVTDTILLKPDNTFFVKFDSLTPGLYSFKHDPEYQYVYFDKNDSLMVRMNSRDFDQSIVFCGKGDEKNNFLMEMYLKVESDNQKMFNVYDYDVSKFISNINTTYNSNKKIYKTHKEEIKWSEEFDVFAKAALDFAFYTKKELYPVIHKIRTGEDINQKLPKDFYNYRKDVDFNNVELSGYSPFIKYLSHMLNNVGAINYHNHFSDVDLALKININKLHIADTLIKSTKVKNTILNNIAFSYFLEDQNMVNNQKFLDIYYKYSTDKSSKNEILKIGNAIQLLKAGYTLPQVNLIDRNGKVISSSTLLKKKTVLFFWSENASSHFIAAHKKVLDFKTKHPDYQFIAINLDMDQSNWNGILSRYKFDGIEEYRCENFENIKYNWAITKVHRTIVLNDDAAIKNAFTNLFNVDFESNF